MPPPLYRGQGNQPYQIAREKGPVQRGQTVPYEVNGAPAGGTVDWGGIGGTLTDQADLAAALADKQDAGAIVQLRSYTVATLPSAAANVRGLIYVSNEAGGAVPAFSDGTNWRRVTDRAIVS